MRKRTKKRELTFTGFLILLASVVVLGITGIVIAKSYEVEDGSQNAFKSQVDYLWVYENTQLQRTSSDFKMACERELERVSDRGLTEREQEDNELHAGEVVDSKIDYDFKYKEKGDKVMVSASCRITGGYEENTLRVIDYETIPIKSTYILVK